MARYIDADLLIKNIAKIEDLRTLSTKTIGEAISKTPTADVVEVVRCRECKNCEIVIDQFDNDWYFCTNTKDNAEVKPDDFCSYGERK